MAYKTKKPAPRASALLGIARRELGLTLQEVASAIDRSWVLVANTETGNVAMGDDTMRRLVCFYLGELGSPAQQPQVPIPQLLEQLARALLTYRVRRAAALLASVDSGADAVVLAVCMDGLRYERVAGKVVRRLRYRLAAEERRRVEGALGPE